MAYARRLFGYREDHLRQELARRDQAAEAVVSHLEAELAAARLETASLQGYLALLTEETARLETEQHELIARISAESDRLDQERHAAAERQRREIEEQEARLAHSRAKLDRLREARRELLHGVEAMIAPHLPESERGVQHG